MELRIEHLSKTYPNGVHALHDVTLTIPRGMFGLLGPNGAGKSTLMRTLATLQEPDAGSVELRGIGSAARRSGSAGRAIQSTCCARRTACAAPSATCRRSSASTRP